MQVDSDVLSFHRGLLLFRGFSLQDRACSDPMRGGGPAPSSHQDCGQFRTTELPGPEAGRARVHRTAASGGRPRWAAVARTASAEDQRPALPASDGRCRGQRHPVVIDVPFGPPVQDFVERNVPLEPGKVRPKAVVHPWPKRSSSSPVLLCEGRAQGHDLRWRKRETAPRQRSGPFPTTGLGDALPMGSGIYPSCRRSQTGRFDNLEAWVAGHDIGVQDPLFRQSGPGNPPACTRPVVP